MTHSNSIYFDNAVMNIKKSFDSFCQPAQFYVTLMTKVIAWLKILAKNFRSSARTFKR